MRKTSIFIFSAIIYIIIWWILAAISVVANLSITGRLTGGYTAFGGIMAFWIAYKFVKWLRVKYFNKEE
jgi:hypothetical protein